MTRSVPAPLAGAVHGLPRAARRMRGPGFAGLGLPPARMVRPLAPPGAVGAMFLPGSVLGGLLGVPEACVRVLESYVGMDPTAAYTLHAANNGHGAAWRRDAPGVPTPELQAVWFDQERQLRAARFDHRTLTWGPVTSIEPACPAPDPWAFRQDLVASPSLAAGRDGLMVVSWLARWTSLIVGGWTDPRFQVCSVRGSGPEEFATHAHASTGAFGSPPPGGDVSYLGTAVWDQGLVMVATEVAGRTDPIRAMMMSFPGSTGLRTLAVDAGVTSDPSVASSRQGDLTFYAWEEVSPPTSETKRIAYAVVRARPGAAPAVEGPYFLEDAATGTTVPGGDVCVCALKGGLYVALQQPRGGIRLFRAPALSRYIGGPIWEEVETGGAGRIGDGFLPNLSGQSLDTGEDLLAVVWEDRPDGQFASLDITTVSLAFAHFDVSQPIPFWISGTKSFWSPQHFLDDRYQVLPSVVVSPPDTVLGRVVVDVFWFEVFPSLNIDIPSMELCHATFDFDGECLWLP